MECYCLHGNDCAYTVAIHIGGTIENFAKMMNEKAKKIGVTNTNFVTPHGLDSEGQYSTALDVAKIMRYAMNNKEIKAAINTESITIKFDKRNVTLSNTNRLLKTYSPVDGGKTGYTANANRCLVATAIKDDLRLIVVVLGATDTNKRFDEAKLLLEKTFERYKLRDISNYLNWYIKIAVLKGNIDTYEDFKKNNLKVALTNEEYDSIYIKQDVLRKIEAPMQKGTKIGKVAIEIEEEKLYEEDIILNVNIEKNDVWDYIKEGMKNMFLKREKI